MNLYLVRHGQSVMNFEKRHSGWSMLPLTEKGFDDARRAGEIIKHISFDRVYSSDLTRAVQTARTALGVEPIQLELIRERSVGCLAERFFEDCAAEYGEAYWQARTSCDFRPFGGDSQNMVRDRARDFLKMLENDPAENIAAFTHGGFIMHCIECVLGVQFSVRNIVIENGAVIHLQHDGSNWKLIL